MSNYKVALAGCPNCGKSAIFNALTGGNQKIGNYPGVTVERKIGRLVAEPAIEVIDLPGIYSLQPVTLDESISVRILSAQDDNSPDLVAVVIDASQLERTLGLLVELKESGKPVVAVCNMMDLAEKAGLHIRTERLSRELQIPVIATIGVKKRSVAELAEKIRGLVKDYPFPRQVHAKAEGSPVQQILGRQERVRHLIEQCVEGRKVAHTVTERLDAIVLHRILGPIILFTLLLMMFQAVFSWAEAPMGWIEDGVAAFGEFVGGKIDESSFLHSFLVDGLIAGVGSVVVFLPQILILFSFILVLEMSGYMMRAAFIMDRLMSLVGLQGRSFVPLLSSFACAIPGIMAARTVKSDRQRLLTILISPLMTCSARLPVYILLIGAFIPAQDVFGFLGLQGLVMFGLFLVGIFSAVGVAFVTSRFSSRRVKKDFIQDMPTYKWPRFSHLGRQLWIRAKLFLKNAGTLILVASASIWFLSTYPAPPENAEAPAIEYSFAGKIGKTVEPLLAPLGFDWRISTALIPGFAAREVMVGALATVYAVEDAEDEEGGGFSVLQQRLSESWPLASGLSLLVWYIFAPQCLATFAVMRRETGSRKWTAIGFSYLLILAYVASFITYQVVSAFTFK